MKKLLTLLTGFVAGSALYAMPVLNPAEPALLTDGVFLCDADDCWGVKVGYRGDFVYNKHMSLTANRHKHFQLFSNSGVLTLNLWDRIDVYGFVGAASYNSESVQLAADASTIVDTLSYSRTRTIWGVGAKVVLWETCWGNCGTTYIGIDAQYENMPRNPLDRVTINGVNANPNGVGYSYNETQVSLGVSHRICALVPYIAVKWSNAHASLGSTRVGASGNVSSGADFASLHSSYHWGYAFGVSLVDANRMTVTAEARFIDESALSIGAEFRF